MKRLLSLIALTATLAFGGAALAQEKKDAPAPAPAAAATAEAKEAPKDERRSATRSSREPRSSIGSLSSSRSTFKRMSHSTLLRS